MNFELRIMEEKPYKILIIDDDPFLSEIYSLKFKLSGFEVSIAANGEKALEAVKENIPDVILLDLVMPKMDGFETLAALRKIPELDKTRIIVFSNLGQKEDVDRGYRLGANDYLIKTRFTPSEVVEKVREVISKSLENRK